MEDLKKEISKRIIKYLEEKNISRKEFLAMINRKGADVTASALQFWIKGEKEPRGNAKKILFEILDISITNPFHEVEFKKFPLLGRVACGEPIWATEQKDCYVMADATINADFVLFCKGDSMTPLVNDGDIVFVRKQDTVNNGEVAVVLLDDEATLKRVYFEKGRITLIAENKKYAPIVILEDDHINVRICGKAVFFQRLIN